MIKPLKFEILDEFNTEDGMRIKCSCGEYLCIFYDSPKECLCGRIYNIQMKLTVEKGEGDEK